MQYIKRQITFTICAMALWGCARNNAHMVTTLPSTKQEKMERDLECDVKGISGLGPGHVGDDEKYENLKERAVYIKKRFREMGYEPNIQEYIAVYDAAYIDSYLKEHKYPPNKRAKNSEKELCYDVENIEVVIPGRDSSAHTPIIIICAHYDTVNGSPGANDNGSGVAAILALAQLIKEEQLEGKMSKTLKLVLFPNEENPYNKGPGSRESRGPNMGSVTYAKRAKENGDNIELAIALDAIGCFDDKPGSQDFPFYNIKYLGAAFEFICKSVLGYSGKADFINFVSDLGSWSCLKKCRSLFNNGQNDFPLETFVFPDLAWLGLGLVGRSDHKSFWLNGFKGILITDTADFRGAHYHQASDTSETVNYPKFAHVVLNLHKMVQGLVVPSA